MKQDIGAIYCHACGLRGFAPVRRRTANVSRTADSVHERLEQQAAEHAEECGVGVTRVLGCDDLHALGGVDLIGNEKDSLVPRGRGGTLVCHYRVWILGDAPAWDWAHARSDLLLPHWHRGCWLLHKAVQAVPEGHGGRARVLCRTDGCEHVTDQHAPGHALVLGWAHAAEHLVGAVTMEAVACLACSAFDVVLSAVAEGLPTALGPPEECECIEPQFWGRTYL